MGGLDIGQIALIGGPGGIIGLIVAYALNSYLSIRRDRREGKTQDISNSGTMAESAQKVMNLVNEATDRMDKRLVKVETELATEKAYTKELEAHINHQDDIIARQEREIDFLDEDLKRAHARIEELERNHGGYAQA